MGEKDKVEKTLEAYNDVFADIVGEKATMDTWLSDTINKAEKKAEKKGEKRGEKRGKIELLVNMIKEGVISLKQAAEQLGMSVEKFEKEAKGLALL